MSLLADLVSSCAFIHDDIDPQLVDEFGNHDSDQFSTNPILLGAKVCVVDTLDGFGEQYLQYLSDVGGMPSQVLIPHHRVSSLVANLISDNQCLSKLNEIIQRDRLHISSFYSSHELNFEGLISKLASPLHTPMLYPPITQFENLNDKVKARILLESKSLPIPEGTICYSATDLTGFWKSRRRFPKMLIKKVHWDTYLISKEKELEEILHKLKYPVVAETYYEGVVSSPVSHFIKWRDKADYLFSLEQTLVKLKHFGNRLPLFLPLPIENQIKQIGIDLISGIQGYFGVAGLDFILTDDNELLIIDLNPRFNASTYPCHFLINQGYEMRGHFVTMRAIEVKVDSLSSIFCDTRFMPLKNQNPGMFLYNPVWDFGRREVFKLTYLCVANSPEELSLLEKKMLGIIADNMR